MFAGGLKPTDPDAQDGFALGTNQTRDSAVTAIRQKLSSNLQSQASLAGEVSIGDGSDIVEIGKLLTAVGALAIRIYWRQLWDPVLSVVQRRGSYCRRTVRPTLSNRLMKAN